MHTSSIYCAHYYATYPLNRGQKKSTPHAPDALGLEGLLKHGPAGRVLKPAAPDGNRIHDCSLVEKSEQR